MNGTVNMVADRSGAAAGQTVTWTTSNAAIATVDAASGVVTGKSNGTVAVTATAGGFSGSATVKVGDGAGSTASVTIASITSGGLQNPVDLNNAQGQIDVTLNIDAAGQTLSKVELVVTDSATGVATVCATQMISASASTAAKAEGVSASVVGASESVAAQAAVTLSCNTAAVAANGAVTFTNGAKSISARVYNGAGALINSASNTVRVRFANESGFIATIANTPTTPAAFRNAEGTAVSTVNGLLYRQGSLKVTLTGANFEPGQSANFATVAGSLHLVNGAGPDPIVLTFKQVEGTQNFTADVKLADIATASGVYELDITGSTTAGGAVGSSHVGGDTEIRIDNVAPVNTGNFDAALATNFFVNAAYPFAASNTALFDAPTAPADASVGGTTVKFYAGTAKQIADLTLPGGVITTAKLAGLKEITTGDQLEATLQNNVYGIIAVTTDKLGNHFAQKLAVNIGVDKVAPKAFAFTTATPKDKASNPTAVYAFKGDMTDDASGFGNAPLFVTVTRTDADDADVCVAPSALDADDACVESAEAKTFELDPAAADYADAGYYTMTTVLSDTAGNRTAPLVRTFLVDADAPTVSGGISIPAVIAPGSSIAFAQNIEDNLDLGFATLSIEYGPGGILLRADSVQLGTYGADVLTTEANPTLTVGSFIRSLSQVDGAGLPVAGNTKATGVNIQAADIAGNLSTISSAALPDANVTGSAKDWTAATVGIAKFSVTNVAKNVKNSSDTTVNKTTPTKIDLTAEVEATSLAINNPFTEVSFWYLEPVTGQLVQIGTATVSVMTDAANTRIFRYTLTGWDPSASLPAGAVTVVAMGMNGGNGLLTVGNANITLVP